MMILYIDDDTEDIEIFEEAVKSIDPTIRYFSATNGEQAIGFLHQCETLPDHIILDINMHGMDGKLCLKEIRKDKKFDPINVVVYSTSGYPGDVEQMQSLRATFIPKATSYGDLCGMIENLVKK